MVLGCWAGHKLTLALTPVLFNVALNSARVECMSTILRLVYAVKEGKKRLLSEIQRIIRDDVSLVTNAGYHRLLTDALARILGCEQATAGLTGVMESLQPGLMCSDSGKRERVLYSKRNIIRRKRLCHTQTHKPCHISSPPLTDSKYQAGQCRTRDICEAILGA